MKSFLDEYTDLENRVTDSFDYLRNKIVSIEFIGVDNEADEEEDYFDFLEENCPTSYYNSKNGVEYGCYVTKIDSDGIHIVDMDDNSKKTIGFNDLNGLYNKIELLEAFNKAVTK